MTLTFEKVFRNIPLEPSFSSQDSLTKVVTDSREVEPGSLFIALPSLKGSEITPFITEALEKGAKAILMDEQTPFPAFAPLKDVTLLRVKNLRLIQTLIAVNLYPRQPSKIVGITGTNGKTSTSFFLHQLWSQAGHKSACLGTLGVVGDTGRASLPGFSLTSPDPFTLHNILTQLPENGIERVALEASSHGLQQYRLEGVNFTEGAFTNLSHDHLDYHGDLQAYFDAKKRFFEELLPVGATAVLNADDPHFPTLLKTCKAQGHQVLSYGQAGREILLESVDISEESQEVVLRLFGRPYKIKLSLIGLFQIYNVLCAIGLAIGTHTDEAAVLEALSQLTPVPGRLERVGMTKNKAIVYVDYAHTPAALANVLTSLRRHVRGDIAVVVGCGGDRDQEKRAFMGAAAHTYADHVYITDDNPRTEDPRRIRQQIKKNCPNAIEIPDRREAIEKAIYNLKMHDVLIIAGKGHEKTQTIGTQKIPFDDREVAHHVLKHMRA